jgi:hypothetical protein
MGKGSSDVSNRRSKQSQDDDYDNGDQDQDERILYKTLTFFLRCEQHGKSPPSKVLLGLLPCEVDPIIGIGR